MRLKEKPPDIQPHPTAAHLQAGSVELLHGSRCCRPHIRRQRFQHGSALCRGQRPRRRVRQRCCVSADLTAVLTLARRRVGSQVAQQSINALSACATQQMALKHSLRGLIVCK